MRSVTPKRLAGLSLAVVLAVGMPALAGAQDGGNGDATKSATEAQAGAGATKDAQGGSNVGPENAEGAPRNAVGDKFELPRYSEGNQIELIAGLCAIQLKDMSEASCTCLAERSLDALSDPQRDYLIASAVAPPVADRMLNDGRVGAPDQSEIFAFLQTSSQSCRAANERPDGDAPAPSSGDESGSEPPLTSPVPQDMTPEAN